MVRRFFRTEKDPVSAEAVNGRAWGWIPSVYIAEGLPYFAVNVLTVIMYTNMGIPKDIMAIYTGALYLPWVIKPFWSPFIDILKTKRWWTLTMQLLICITMALVAFFISHDNYFEATLIVFWCMAFFSATHDIAADGYYMMALDEKAQAAFVGVRSTFYRIASVLGQGGIVILAGELEKEYGNIPQAWAMTFGILSLIFLAIFLWDWFIMPKPFKDRPMEGVKAKDIIRNFGETFVSFFRKRHIWIALAFMLLYRLPEALCLKLVAPFLLNSEIEGGMGLTTSEVGFANGTIGVIALLAGGIIGGIVIARDGLRRWIWPMAMALTLPCGVYCLFSIFHPDYTWICIGLGVEQFGYGFGFTAYMLYLMYFSAGESQTSHYAFCTAFMAMGMMLPGMGAGWLFNICEMADSSFLPGDGYLMFFSVIMLTCLATFLSVALVRPTLSKK